MGPPPSKPSRRGVRRLRDMRTQDRGQLGSAFPALPKGRHQRDGDAHEDENAGRDEDESQVIHWGFP